GNFERLLAIKVPHAHLLHEPELMAMFLDEARLAARIRHPNVVPTVDVCVEDELFFLVMEYVEGDHLSSLIRSARQAAEPLDPTVGVRIVHDALLGLAAAHSLKDKEGRSLN